MGMDVSYIHLLYVDNDVKTAERSTTLLLFSENQGKKSVSVFHINDQTTK